MKTLNIHVKTGPKEDGGTRKTHDKRLIWPRTVKT